MPPEPRVNVGGAPADFNAVVLRVIDHMPEGGSYAANAEASRALASAVSADSTGLYLDPLKARPSYCSGATYLVFVGALRELMLQGQLNLDSETRTALTIHGQRDGEGLWGRWNANGPGTARAFRGSEARAEFHRLVQGARRRFHEGLVERRSRQTRARPLRGLSRRAHH